MALAGTMLLGGCVLNGDFDRVRPSLVTDDMHAWVGREAVAGIGLPASEYRLTDDERALRDLAYPLIAPPYDRNQWDSVWREYGIGHPPAGETPPFDRAAYWLRLNDTYRRSQESGYAEVITDARNDVVRIDPFFAVAGRVIDMDQRRAKSLAYVSGLTAAEHGNALARNNENAAIVAWVCRSLRERAATYHYALERLVIMAPSATAVEVERTLTLLQMRIGQYCQRAEGATVAPGRFRASAGSSPQGRIVTKD